MNGFQWSCEDYEKALPVSMHVGTREFSLNFGSHFQMKMVNVQIKDVFSFFRETKVFSIKKRMKTMIQYECWPGRMSHMMNVSGTTSQPLPEYWDHPRLAKKLFPLGRSSEEFCPTCCLEASLRNVGRAISNFNRDDLKAVWHQWSLAFVVPSQSSLISTISTRFSPPFDS